MFILSINNNLIKQDVIIGSRRITNYFWAVLLFFGSTGFLLAGLSSYLQINLLFFTDTTKLFFIPQGLTMLLYGTIGLFLDIYLWLIIIWNVGSGYNEFNKANGQVSIFRWGFPGKNRRLKITCSIEDIQAIKINIKKGLNPSNSIYLKVKGKLDIPLTVVGQPLRLVEIEDKAADLASFLNVPFESSI
uniref:Photosystem I assembly protein Ycf4 n=1 Tax=Cyanoptyche gloeocystis TaxID=77922 RepID=A0A3G1IWI3_9EUKA|nr:photosystem I assembly protein Ycf4 [Cyanoptyche gloeocystis]